MMCVATEAKPLRTRSRKRRTLLLTRRRDVSDRFGMTGKKRTLAWCSTTRTRLRVGGESFTVAARSDCRRPSGRHQDGEPDRTRPCASASCEPYSTARGRAGRTPPRSAHQGGAAQHHRRRCMAWSSIWNARSVSRRKSCWCLLSACHPAWSAGAFRGQTACSPVARSSRHPPFRLPAPVVAAFLSGAQTV